MYGQIKWNKIIGVKCISFVSDFWNVESWDHGIFAIILKKNSF